MHSVITVLLVMTNHLYIVSTFLTSLLIFNKVNNITNSSNKSTFFYLFKYYGNGYVYVGNKFRCKRIDILTYYKL